MARCNTYFGSSSPGVSTKIACIRGVVTMPVTLSRVVCAFGVTMLSFSPTSALSSVDFPTLGRPTSATCPALVASPSPSSMPRK
jgi:hypothetical protein